jgi:hypothetical protein
MPDASGQGHPETATTPSKPARPRRIYLITAFVVTIFAIALIIFLCVAVPAWTGAGDRAAPQKTVEKLLEAMEEKRADVYLSLWTDAYRDMLQQMMEGMEYTGSMEGFVREMIFPFESIRFEGMEYRTKIEGSRATVEAVAGKLIITEYGGKEHEAEIANPGDIYFKLVESEGEWRISKFWFFDMSL